MVDPVDMPMSEGPLRVFFSFQTDLHGRRSLLSDALDHAAKKVGKDLGQEIEILFAMRGADGAPNIRDTILSRIDESDWFVADVSIVNSRQGQDGRSQRLMPNPNVVFELGYAVSKLGWSRIAMLYDRSVCRPEDFPFDYRQHRAAHFVYVDKQEDGEKFREMRTQLRRTLYRVLSMASEKRQRPRGLTWVSAPERSFILREALNECDLIARLVKLHLEAFPESGIPGSIEPYPLRSDAARRALMVVNEEADKQDGDVVWKYYWSVVTVDAMLSRIPVAIALDENRVERSFRYIEESLKSVRGMVPKVVGVLEYLLQNRPNPGERLPPLKSVAH